MSSVSEEMKERLASLRGEYGVVVTLWRFIATSRAILLATTTTAVGVMMNSMRSGVATVHSIQSGPMGPVIIFSPNVPDYFVAITIGVIVALVVSAIIAADITLGRAMGGCLSRGEALETDMAIGRGVLTVLKEHQFQMHSVFFAGRIILGVVACFWVLAVLVPSSNLGGVQP